MNSIKIIKLINGEELIGAIITENKEQYMELNTIHNNDKIVFISNPLKINSTYNEESKNYSIYLLDWIPSITSTIFPIEIDKILTLGIPTMELSNRYYEIILAGKYEPDENEISDELLDLNFDDDEVQ